MGDIHASIFAGVGFHEGLSRTPKRKAILKMLKDIEGVYSSVEDDELFEKSPEVDGILAQAELMKDELVKSNKQRLDRN